MRARLSSRSFVGREGELAELQLAVREANLGRPGLVLLGGDSGVGKTRLLAELIARLGDGGDSPLVLRGEAVQPTDGELPYAPLLGALRPLARDGHPVLDELHAGTRAVLGTLLPELAPGETAPDLRRDDGAGQLRLFEAVLALVHRLAGDATVVLVLEDMHWADRSSRGLVSFLAHSLRDERAVTVLSYRADELHRRHPLRALLSELERVEGARRVDLTPFDRDELARALTDILGSPPDPALLERLFTRAEGNPLYTEELLAAGLDGRGAPPQSLSDAFLSRIEQLSDDGQQALRAIAIGGSLDQPALAAVTGLPDAPLLSALREAVATQVIVAGVDGAFRFRHALLREALADDLLPGERGDLHRRLAAHLEQTGGDDDRDRRARIAAHYAAAGDQRAALRATAAAADAACDAWAFGDAAGLYERLLELWPRVDDAAALTGADRVTWLDRCADALMLVGRPRRAEALLEEAVGLLDVADDPERHAQLLYRRGVAMWGRNRGADAIEVGKQALAACPDDDGATALEIRAWLSRLQVLRGRHRDAFTAAQAALATAVAAGARDAEVRLRDTLGQALLGLGETEAGLDSLHLARTLARELDQPDALATVVHNLADDLGHLGRAREGLEIAREGLAEVPSGFVLSRDVLMLTVSRLAFESGDWVLAAQSVPASGGRTGGQLFLHALAEAELAAGVGDDDRAQTSLGRISELIARSEEPQCIGPYGLLSAELHRRQGDLEAARTTIEEAIGRLEICTDDVFRIVGLSVAGLRIEGDRALRGSDLGDAALRDDALARARIHMSRLESIEDPRPVVQAALAEARAELARIEGRAAGALWERAAGAWEELELPYRAALARWREVESRVAEGDRAGAVAPARVALGIAAGLGSRWLERELRGLADRARLALEETAPDGAPESAATGAPAVDNPFGLTEREHQVLGLLAQGATNRQIGAALYMAEKTASVHVSRILAKLDVRGRTEAAAVAHRQHLV